MAESVNIAVPVDPKLKSHSPPLHKLGPYRWAQTNLFSSPFNTLLTLCCLALLFVGLTPAIRWAIIDANFLGDSQKACTGDGACWVFIKMRFEQILYGFYPAESRWRIHLTFFLFIAGGGALFIPRFRHKLVLCVFLLIGFPFIAKTLLFGNRFGLAVVETSLWGGLTLTLIVATVGIVASLPIGIVLALSRRGSLPVLRTLSVLFIEGWRAVPLITVLFMSSVMVPLFLPEGVTLDKLLRALIGITLFSSAYMAEVIRGGLQAIPMGQYEAAKALGLGYWKTHLLIILPQALKTVIPGIVNTFIGLFKDTTLVLIIGLFDVLGIVQAAAADPNWLGNATEGYVFAGLCFFIFCFGISRYSQHLEKRLSYTKQGAT